MATQSLARVEPTPFTLAHLGDASASLLALWHGGKDAATVLAYRRDLEAFERFHGFICVPAALDAFFASDAGLEHTARRAPVA